MHDELRYWRWYDVNRLLLRVELGCRLGGLRSPHSKKNR